MRDDGNGEADHNLSIQYHSVGVARQEDGEDQNRPELPEKIGLESCLCGGIYATGDSESMSVVRKSDRRQYCRPHGHNFGNLWHLRGNE